MIKVAAYFASKLTHCQVLPMNQFLDYPAQNTLLMKYLIPFVAQEILTAL
jgi:hypothetical protein